MRIETLDGKVVREIRTTDKPHNRTRIIEVPSKDGPWYPPIKYKMLVHAVTKAYG